MIKKAYNYLFCTVFRFMYWNHNFTRNFNNLESESIVVENFAERQQDRATGSLSMINQTE